MNSPPNIYQLRIPITSENGAAIASPTEGIAEVRLRTRAKTRPCISIGIIDCWRADIEELTMLIVKLNIKTPIKVIKK